ncbi:MAG: hypothetical protein AAF376_08945 [Pseudomonadota bacterium]
MAQDGDAREIYALAVRLGRSASEILDMPMEEVRGFIAFLAWEAKQSKKS